MPERPDIGATMRAWLERYRGEPASFVREMLGVMPDPWQAALMAAVARGERRVSVRSGHGVGKSSVAAWLALWHILTRYPQKTIVTAPTGSQLYDALFAELKRWARELPPLLAPLLDVKSDRIELAAAPAESFISARTSRAETPEALQGVHSEHVLLIADEASGIPEPVFAAAAGSMSGHSACTILLGNPTRGSGFFFDTHHRLKQGWWTLQVSCADCPRVSPAFIDEMAARYGTESNAFRVRVLGEFPRRDDDTVIPLELVEAAMHRDVAGAPTASAVWGLDVARFGSDASALAIRRGNVVSEVRTWRGLDLMQTCGAVKHEYDGLAPEERPAEILVDSIGLGAGVCDRLRELGLPARGVNVAESPSLGATYANLRAELWFRLKAWLEARDCRIPKDEALFAELTAPRYAFTSSGKMKVEAKDDLKRRGLPSPDRADALCLTLATDAATALYGAAPGRGWNAPLRRHIRGVV
jgi:phage terminase large subunit